MSRKVQTIYEYFKEYSEEMIDKVISDLNPEDKKLLVIRYGEDLHNPCSKEEWSNTKYNYQFYIELHLSFVQNMNDLLLQ